MCRREKKRICDTYMMQMAVSQTNRPSRVHAVDTPINLDMIRIKVLKLAKIFKRYY